MKNLFKTDLEVGQKLNIWHTRGPINKSPDLFCTITSMDASKDVIGFYVENGDWHGYLTVSSGQLKVDYTDTICKVIKAVTGDHVEKYEGR